MADVRAGTFGPDLEAALRRGRHRLHPRPLAPVDGPLDRRRLAGLPGRRAVLDPLREDRGHGHRPRGGPGRRPHRAHRGARAPRGHRARTSPSSSWAARAPSASSPRPGSGSTPCPPARSAGPSASPPSPTGSTPAAGSCAAGRHPAVLRLYDQTESARNFDQPDTNVLIVLDEADPASWRRTLAVVDEECGPSRGAAARRRPGRAVARPPQRRLGPRPAVARRHRGRHRRDRRPVGGAARPLRRASSARSGDRGHAGRLGPPVPRLHRRRLPLLHLRRARARGRRRVARSATTARPGTPVTDATHGPRRGHQPPPRHRAQPVPLPAAGPRLGLRRARRAQGDASTRRASSTRASSASPRPFGPAPWP